MTVTRTSPRRPPAERPTAPPTGGFDPWEVEAARPKRAATRPELGPVRPASVLVLGMLAALRAVGLVLVAGAVAAGIAGLQRGAFDPREILLLGATGAILRSGSGWATEVAARRIAIAVKRTLRRDLWRRIAQGAPEAGEGGLAVLATDGLDDLDDYYVRSLPALIAAVVVPAIVGLRILGADWVSALVVVLTVPLVPFFMALIGRHTQARTDEALGALSRLADHLTELARGLPVLVGLGRVAEQARALDGVQRAYRTRTQETLRWAFLSALVLELIATISVAVVAVFLGLRLMERTVPLEAALLVLILAPECFAVVREVGTAFHASQNGLSALQRVREILAGPSRRSPDERPVGKTDAASPRGAVTLRGLAVRYPGRAASAFGPLDARLEGTTAITGPSGSGKSTLLAALAGTLPADAEVSGSLHGADGVAYAPQAPRGFADTPREELVLFGAPDPVAALAELGLADVADARIAELSPGELRRLAVARALARVDRGATLLVLDEPTAHLDRASADRVRAAIRSRAARTTVVLATHEPETLALAERSVRVDAPGRSRGVDSAATLRRAVGDAGAHRVDRPQRVETAERRDRAPERPLLPWLLGILLAFAAVGMGLALSAVSGWLIVRASVEEYIMYLLVAIVGVRFFGIGRSLARYTERLFTHEAAFRMVDALRLRLWHAIAARGAGSRRLLEGGTPVDYLVVLADELRDLLPRVIPPLAVGALSLVGVTLTTALVQPHLTGVVLVTLTAAAVVGAVLAIAAARGAQRARIAGRSEVVRGTAALSAAAADLRGNRVADRALDVLAEADARLARAERRVAWGAGLGGAVVVLATTLLAVAAPLLSTGSPAELTCVIALLALATLEPLADFVAAAHRLPALREVRTRIATLSARPDGARTHAEDDHGPSHESVPAPRPAARIGEIALHALAARYGDTEVFSGVHGVARAGEWLVVEGPSGSGKSTLLSIVMGALPAAAGAVRVDGVPLADLDADAWRARVAWCPQDAYVFDSTLRGNLLLARARADAPSDAEMTAVLDRVGLGPLLRTLPRGLDTRVGPGGSALSGGERQRLAVARALLTRAEVILLDEPTAHLDAPTAAAMMSDLRRATEDRIVLLVSHRADDRRPGDRVLTLA
ncbi:thiol reductant ABC exporter subunit CydC [Microbacterium sp. JZ31]|uniref:thiol reductant ABC exporter subunit CydC n=1 Tax=Microbacterium sp. JZ31 TaxID=1906274 RepID=UPI0019339ADE|nr:thiol reductant ABC exporter subunit CydC [Microbacterium sp. JZ31]